MNVLVTGSSGQVGSEIKEIIQKCPQEMPLGTTFNIQNFNYHFTTSQNLDITEYLKVKEFIQTHKIDVIINCAAYTAVDKAEEDELNADNINHLAVKNLAQIAKEKNIKLIHISTDYVFDGTSYKPYTEDDTTNPNGFTEKLNLQVKKLCKR